MNGKEENMDNGRLRFTLDDIEETALFDPRLAGMGLEPPPGAVIKVVGVGGGGGNAVARMVGAGVTGVEFIAVNTDAQALAHCPSSIKIQIGSRLTRGLGAGARPEVGREAAQEDTDRLIEALTGADMVFITTGLGGGTGTGASPVIADLAAQLGALVVAVVTKPFSFEGRVRREQAERGLSELKSFVDTVITIPNDKLLATVEQDTGIRSAFLIADDVLRQAVQGISDLILIPGEINRDFADVRTVMKGMGMALMGAGVAEGPNRAVAAAQQAISSPLLEDTSIQGAKGVIFNITGGDDLTLHEVNEAASIIHDAADPNATILFGFVTRPEMKGKVKVTVIATGFHPPAGLKTGAPARTAQGRETATTLKDLVNGAGEGPVLIQPVRPPQPEGFEGFEDPGQVAHLDPPSLLDRSDFEIPAFMRRMQD